MHHCWTKSRKDTKKYFPIFCWCSPALCAVCSNIHRLAFYDRIYISLKSQQKPVHCDQYIMLSLFCVHLYLTLTFWKFRMIWENQSINHKLRKAMFSLTFDHQMGQSFIELSSVEHFKQFKAWLVEFRQIQSILKREKNKWFRCQIYLSKIKEKQICSESRKWMSLGKAWTSSKYINCWLHHQWSISFHDILYY